MPEKQRTICELPNMIEQIARGIAKNGFGRDWDDFLEVNAHDTDQSDLMDYARAAVDALWKPTEAMWGGLARDLVMWDRGMPNQYGSTLYKHLKATGRPIPTWLEEEIPDTAHTPPKGTVAVCIFKAMLDDALGSELSNDDRGSAA